MKTLLSASPRILGFTLLLCAFTGDARSQLAVIAHPAVQVDDLSQEELRRIFLGRSTNFSDGTPIVLIENSGARASFYQSILGRTVSRVRQHWIAVVFSGGTANPPTEVAERDAVQTVSQTPGAISFVELSRVDSSVKVLRIDGLRPQDSGYPIP